MKKYIINIYRGEFGVLLLILTFTIYVLVMKFVDSPFISAGIIIGWFAFCFLSSIIRLRKKEH